MSSSSPTGLLRALLAFLVLWLGVVAAPARAQSWTATPRDAVVLRERPPAVPEGWERVSATYLEVYGEPDTMPVLLELSRHGSKSLPILAQKLGVAIGGTIHVVVAPTQKQFFALQPGRAPEWADGTAYPALGQIFLRRPAIRGPQRPLTNVLDHELVHILLGRAFAPQVPPRWLQEGFAQVFSGEYGPDTTREIARGAAGGGLFSLEALTSGFPDDPHRAQLAYAESADFVSWLEQQYGPEALRTVVARTRQGEDVHAALYDATGLFLDDLDKAWSTRLARGNSSFWMAAFTDGSVFWMLAAIFAAVGLVLARRRSRRRFEELKEAERRRDALMRALWRGDGPVG